MKLRKKIITDHNHDKFITTQKFNRLISEDFAARLKQVNVARKTDISDVTGFLKKTDLDNKLRSFNKSITSNITKDIEFKTKLDDLEKIVEMISKKGLTADLINKYGILNKAKYFF